MIISRGLAALLFFFSTTLFANYLYKDEVVFLDSVAKKINTIGKELQDKSSIGLYVIVLKELPAKTTMLGYEKEIMQKFGENSIVLVLSESTKEVDIMTKSEDLNRLFDEAQILNPTLNTGSILPILKNRSDKESVEQNVGRAIVSAYSDLANQIAHSKDITLVSDPDPVKYFYKDEVVFLDYVNNEINAIGKELKEKSGISIYVIALKELPNGIDIVEYEKNIAHELKEPLILLTLSEYDKQIDILARPQSLYKLFDKSQILSPMPNSGTILPILTMKAKKATTAEKFGAAIQNGYTDLADQVATAKNVTLLTAPGNANKEVFFVLRVLFYGFILYALYLYIKRKYVMRKLKNEKR